MTILLGCLSSRKRFGSFFFLKHFTHSEYTRDQTGGIPDSMQAETRKSSFPPWSWDHDHGNHLIRHLERGPRSELVVGQRISRYSHTPTREDTLRQPPIAVSISSSACRLICTQLDIFQHPNSSSSRRGRVRPRHSLRLQAWKYESQT